MGDQGERQRRKYTTPEVAEAAGVSDQTIRRWVKLGLLPTPERIHRGGRGVHSLFPASAVAQARWIKEQLERNDRTIKQVREALLAGEFKPSAKDDP